MYVLFLLWAICLTLPNPVIGVGPLKTNDDLIDTKANGVIRLDIDFDLKNEGSKAEIDLDLKNEDSGEFGKESAVGFLISLPSGLKEYEHRVALACGHSFDLEPDYKILLKGKSQAIAITGTSGIKDFKLHPQYLDDSSFVDLCLILLDNKLQKEDLTLIKYNQDTPSMKGSQSASLTAWGPSKEEENSKDYKKRNTSLQVRLDEDQAAEEVITLGGVPREVITSPGTTYLSYYHIDPQSINKESIEKYNLNFSPVYLLQGDSGSRLLVNNEDPAIAMSGGEGEVEGVKGSLHEMAFLRVQPYHQWIESVVKTWAKQGI